MAVEIIRIKAVLSSTGLDWTELELSLATTPPPKRKSKKSEHIVLPKKPLSRINSKTKQVQSQQKITTLFPQKPSQTRVMCQYSPRKKKSVVFLTQTPVKRSNN